MTDRDIDTYIYISDDEELTIEIIQVEWAHEYCGHVAILRAAGMDFENISKALTDLDLEMLETLETDAFIRPRFEEEDISLLTDGIEVETSTDPSEIKAVNVFRGPMHKSLITNSVQVPAKDLPLAELWDLPYVPSAAIQAAIDKARAEQ